MVVAAYPSLAAVQEGRLALHFGILGFGMGYVGMVQEIGCCLIFKAARIVLCYASAKILKLRCCQLGFEYAGGWFGYFVSCQRLSSLVAFLFTMAATAAAAIVAGAVAVR